MIKINLHFDRNTLVGLPTMRRWAAAAPSDEGPKDGDPRLGAAEVTRKIAPNLIGFLRRQVSNFLSSNLQHRAATITQTGGMYS